MPAEGRTLTVTIVDRLLFIIVHKTTLSLSVLASFGSFGKKKYSAEDSEFSVSSSIKTSLFLLHSDVIMHGWVPN